MPIPGAKGVVHRAVESDGAPVSGLMRRRCAGQPKPEPEPAWEPPQKLVN
jgi:hypothetical protein